jgi:hypothetical protein
MATLVHKGIEATLPAGFEGTIFQRAPVGGASTYAVAHFASFALPPATADFGGGVTTLMGPSDIFAVLFEYGPESAGTALFARQSMPRALAPSDYRPYQLKRGVGGQAGTQWFFTESGRPFTLYVVLGAYTRRTRLAPVANDLLGGIVILPQPSPEVVV